ncbi:hypothetical protein S7711_08484 [Stachybotrys chartarum IBT 7711]|uniref:Uncharacterized protein n=1 Tax=Stachybotrys chartarum (strain CBS 109288 / IBT 7711) TaxID=1280523 RepID=A0A084BCN2_STACB|nr:hypothetical protein S7711_08484 [Stachybotrys chartarum IBT 7711]
MSETSLQEKPDVKSYINDRDFNAESEYEYGSRAGFWRLFRLFEKYGMKLTLCAVAEALEAQQEAVTRRVTRPRFSAAQESFIQQATQSLKALSGHAPHGWFYCGSSLNSRTLVPTVYADMGEELIWASDTYASDVPYWVDLPLDRDSAAPKGCFMVPYSDE